MVMSGQSLFGVITTVQEPTNAVRQLSKRLREAGGRLIVVGDKKGPLAYDLDGVDFLALKDQLESRFELARKMPTGHYARKNIGYLVAITEGASCIYETDDDNTPLEGWTVRGEGVEARAVAGNGWVNVSRLFTEEKIWPRGFPLDEIAASYVTPPAVGRDQLLVKAPIQQGLADNSPDVDAVWRLVLDKPIYFRQEKSVVVVPGAWCPFNSQSTWWWPIAYPLLYLPSYCSFRMTDIWRSFIAQRCLWELDLGVVFHPSEVLQERNEHDLMRDFIDEIPGYSHNKELVILLDDLILDSDSSSVGMNLLRCYEALVTAGLFPPSELELISAWLKALNIL